MCLQVLNGLLFYAFLQDSFTTSNFSMAFPYVSVSAEIETMENSLISGFTETCEHHQVHDVAFLGSCSIEGAGLTKLASLHAVHVIYL